MAGEIIVKVKPDTKELDKELKKPRTFSGLLGFGGAGDGVKETKTVKASEKTNNLLGGILKAVGAVAILGTLLSGLTSVIEPFVKLFAAISALLFFPLIKTFLPLIKQLSAFISDIAAEGGGFSGFFKAIIDDNEDEIATDFIGLGAILTGLFIAAFSSGLLGIPLLISGFILLNVNQLVENITNSIGKFWTGLLGAILAGAAVIGLAAVGGWIFALLALLTTAIVVFLPELKKFGKFVWDKLIFFTIKPLLLLIRYGPWLWEKITSIVSRGLEILSNIGSFIFDKIKSFFSFGGGGEVEGRANGGPVSAGTPFMVGERGPELFVPRSSGNIIPNGSFGGGGITQNISINATINNDMDIRDLANRLAELSKDELSMSTGSQRF